MKAIMFGVVLGVLLLWPPALRRAFWWSCWHCRADACACCWVASLASSIAAMAS